MKFSNTNWLGKATVWAAVFGLVWSVGASARGGGGTGGGQGIVCRRDDGSVSKAEVLDLAEATGYYLLDIKDKEQSRRPYMDIAREAAAKLDAAVPNSLPMTMSSRNEWMNNANVTVKSYELNPSPLMSHFGGPKGILSLVESIESGKKMIPGKVKIPPTKDSNPRILPGEKNCSIEQIAVYTDGDEEVHFVEEVWKKLSNVNRAALLIHEALYRTLRSMGETDSDHARKTVGYLFGGLSFSWVLDGVPLERFLSCWTEGGDFQFVLYPYLGANGGFIAQFLVYDGEVMLTKTATQIQIPMEWHDTAQPYQWITVGVPELQYWSKGPDVAGMTSFLKIYNRLLDKPSLVFSYRTATAPFGDHISANVLSPPHGTGVFYSQIKAPINYYKDTLQVLTMSFEAFSGVAGKNAKAVSCNPYFTQAVVKKGEVSVGYYSP